MKRLSFRADLDRIEADAATWIGRRDVGLTESEQRELEAWRTADPRHADALKRFESTWSALGRPQRTGRSSALTRELQNLKRRRQRRWSGAAGAGLLVLLVAGTVWWTPRDNAPDSAAMIVLPNHRTLPDGSVIQHPAATEMTVDFSGPVRRVILHRGEAHFQVATNAERPFVVEAAGVEVRAVGTAFAVDVGKEAVDVLVTEGRVSVEPIATPAAVPAPAPVFARVEAGERVVVKVDPAKRPATPLLVTSVPETEIAAQLAWRNPHVEFSGTPLAEVVAFLNRHNSVQLVIENRGFSTPLSGRFRIDDTETFVRMLETGFGVTSERRDQRIILRKQR